VGLHDLKALDMQVLALAKTSSTYSQSTFVSLLRVHGSALCVLRDRRSSGRACGLTLHLASMMQLLLRCNLGFAVFESVQVLMLHV